MACGSPVVTTTGGSLPGSWRRRHPDRARRRRRPGRGHRQAGHRPGRPPGRRPRPPPSRRPSPWARCAELTAAAYRRAAARSPGCSPWTRGNRAPDRSGSACSEPTTGPAHPASPSSRPPCASAASRSSGPRPGLAGRDRGEALDGPQPAVATPGAATGQHLGPARPQPGGRAPTSCWSATSATSTCCWPSCSPAMRRGRPGHVPVRLRHRGAGPPGGRRRQHGRPAGPAARPAGGALRVYLLDAPAGRLRRRRPRPARQEARHRPVGAEPGHFALVRRRAAGRSGSCSTAPSFPCGTGTIAGAIRQVHSEDIIFLIVGGRGGPPSTASWPGSRASPSGRPLRPDGRAGRRPRRRPGDLRRHRQGPAGRCRARSTEPPAPAGRS